MIPAFMAGLALESLAVFWVHFSERNQRMALLLVGLLQGIAQVLGIGESLTQWPCAVAYVLGFGFGSLLGVELKRKWLSVKTS